MCSEVAFHASVLTKLPVVGILNRGHGVVESPHPHSHAYILHFKELPPESNVSPVNTDNRVEL